MLIRSALFRDIMRRNIPEERKAHRYSNLLDDLPCYFGDTSTPDTRRQKLYRYVWWWVCFYLKHEEHNKHSQRLLSYGMYRHSVWYRFTSLRGITSQKKAPFKVTTLRTLNFATAINSALLSTLSSFSLSFHPPFFRFFQQILSPLLSVFYSSVSLFVVHLTPLPVQVRLTSVE